LREKKESFSGKKNDSFPGTCGCRGVGLSKGNHSQKKVRGAKKKVGTATTDRGTGQSRDNRGGFFGGGVFGVEHQPGEGGKKNNYEKGKLKNTHASTPNGGIQKKKKTRKCKPAKKRNEPKQKRNIH